MKRQGFLFDQVCDFNALVESAKRAAKGKKHKPRIAEFLQHIEREALQLEHELATKTYRPLP